MTQLVNEKYATGIDCLIVESENGMPMTKRRVLLGHSSHNLEIALSQLLTTTQPLDQETSYPSTDRETQESRKRRSF